MQFRRFIICSGFILCAGCSDSQPPQKLDDFRTNNIPIISGVQTESILRAAVFNSVVSISIHNHPDYSDQTLCSGTLISPRHILTSAHCVADLSNQFALFSEDPNDPDCNWTAGFVSTGSSDLIKHLIVLLKFNTNTITPNDSFNIKTVTYHSGFAHIAHALNCLENGGYEGYEITQNDIAILELDRDVPTEIAEPTPILPPWLGITQNQIAGGFKMFFSGYGYDSIGLKGFKDEYALELTKYCSPDDNPLYCPYGKTVQIQGCHPNAATCRKNGEANYSENRIALPSKSFFYLQNNNGPCSGDSGGPGFVKIGKKFYVAGITSYGDAVCRNYGISTAVQDYYDWIIKIAPEAAKTIVEVCDNFIDDDNNGLIDQNDPACAGAPFCGDGILNGDEMCDGNEFFSGYSQCEDWSFEFESGTVTCNNDCTLNMEKCIRFTPPLTCGNGVIDEGEQCDGSSFADMYKELMTTNNCRDFSLFFSGGTLSCYDNCTVNTENCTSDLEEMGICGNGILEPGEFCDGDLYNDELDLTCNSWWSGFTNGNLVCDENCNFSLENCTAENHCGDGLIGDNEYCDGKAIMLDITSCADWSVRYSSGKVSCFDNCTLDNSECDLTPEAAELCGNGILDGETVYHDYTISAEDCDGNLFKYGEDCTQWGDRYTSGKVTCNPNCTINLNGCSINDKTDIIDDEHALNLVLDNESKPNVFAPVKPNDSVTYTPGNAPLKEDLEFKSTSSDDTPDPGTDPQPEDDPVDDPPQTDPPQTDPPQTDPQTAPETPELPDADNDSQNSGCSALPIQNQNYPGYLAPFLLCMLGLKNRRRFLK